jgi:hypothetical protein
VHLLNVAEESHQLRSDVVINKPLSGQ